MIRRDPIAGPPLRTALLACLLTCLVAGLLASTAVAAPGDYREEDGRLVPRPPPSFERPDGPLTEPSKRFDSATRNVYDAAILRPAQFVLLVGSAAVFVPAWPIGALFGWGPDVTELCITQPVERVFDRPLGEL